MRGSAYSGPAVVMTTCLHLPDLGNEAVEQEVAQRCGSLYYLHSKASTAALANGARALPSAGGES